MGDQPPHPAAGVERHRTVFMGTPDFAVPTLTRLMETQDVVGVFTQPDRPAGRGLALKPSPVKRVAQDAGIPVFQPRSFRTDAAAVADLAALEPAVVVVAAYRLLLTPDVLAVPPHGALNVHASLLPRWRGAAPVTYAILEGDARTGVTIMLMDEGLDTGPRLDSIAIDVAPDATAGRLTAELSHLGAALMASTLPRWIAGEIEPDDQDDAQATYAPLVSRADARLDWALSAVALERRVRAMNPWPGAHCVFDGAELKVHRAAALEDGAAGNVVGSVVRTACGPAIVTGRGMLRLDEVQPAGGRRMTGDEFCRGRPAFLGARLALPSEDQA